MKKLTAIMLSLLTVIVSFAITAHAAEIAQDGIEIDLVTDKATYATNEQITSTLTVTNTNDFAVTNVSLQSITPEGYQLTSNSENLKQIEVLNAKESVVLTVTYAPNYTPDADKDNTDQNTPDNSENNAPSPSAPDSNNADHGDSNNTSSGTGSAQDSSISSPQTGDNTNLALYIVIMLISGVGLIATLLMGKKKKKAFLSILLCAVMIGSSVSVMPAYAAQTNSAEKFTEVSAAVQVDNKEVTISAKISYTLPGNPEPDNGNDDNQTDGSKVLVAYFSATNTTGRIAEYLSDGLHAGLYEIVPADPYTSADLNYGDSSSRTSIEMNDPNSRPEISGSVENMTQYDIVFLGYPIWWGEAPKIISTFLESYDFSGKTIVPFCTSGSSGIGSSATNLHTLANSAQWLDGRRFSGNTSRDEVMEWANGLGLDFNHTQPEPVPTPVEDGFALIQGGTFRMGSPVNEPERSSDEAQHSVTVGNFYMARTEVSQKDYQAVAGTNPSVTKGDNLPVTNITWYDAIQYCNKLSAVEGLTPCYTISGTTVTWNKAADGYRLPTEAEWEYAARADTTTPFNFGDYVHNSDANCYNAYGYNNDASGNWVNGSDAYLRKTVPVDRYSANAYGLYNMHGNVAEWVWDWYGEYDADVLTNPTGPEGGNAKIVRGGGWNDHPKHIRSAYRGAHPADVGLYSIGFRPMRSAETATGEIKSVYSADAVQKTGKTLIVYFSQTGNTERLANLIHEMSGADIFRLERKIPYASNSNGPVLYGEALDELRSEATPELKEYPNIDQYDTILLGYCNWWSSIPASVRSILMHDDFSKKTIVPFCSMGGGQFGQTISAIAKLAPNSVIKEGLMVSYSSYNRNEISAWLEKSLPTQNSSDSGNEYTESLIFVKDGDAYTVTGIGEETTVIIPAEYEGLPVTKIQGDYGNGAFAQKAITSVTIPDTVTEIGQNTFYGCKQLAEIKLSANSTLTTIGNNAFSACSALKSITIPKGVTAIGDNAFNNCSSLESFAVARDNTVFRSENGHLIEIATQTLIRGVNNPTIPNGVKALEVRSFQRANGITELSIPKSVTKIGNYFINESTVAKINYAGTEAEWQQIEMKSMWDYGNRNVQVVYAGEPVTPSKPKILVAYFSATNNTENIAGYIKTTLGDDADVYEILAEIPYTAADLNYNTDCRANREQDDPNARPAISGSVENMEQYDIVFLGYPTWWGQAPKIISTFLESYDFSGKTIVPFCTSGSSGIGSSATNLHALTSNTSWLDGRRFSGSTSNSVVIEWVNSLGLNLNNNVQ